MMSLAAIYQYLLLEICVRHFRNEQHCSLINQLTPEMKTRVSSELLCKL